MCMQREDRNEGERDRYMSIYIYIDRERDHGSVRIRRYILVCSFMFIHLFICTFICLSTYVGIDICISVQCTDVSVCICVCLHRYMCMLPSSLTL